MPIVCHGLTKRCVANNEWHLVSNNAKPTIIGKMTLLWILQLRKHKAVLVDGVQADYFLPKLFFYFFQAGFARF